jgi:seryl-tRNA synthetase
MADLMSKTKKELVVIIKELLAAQSQADDRASESQSPEFTERIQALEKEIEELCRVNKQLAGDNQALKKIEDDYKLYVEELIEQIGELKSKLNKIPKEDAYIDQSADHLPQIVDALATTHGLIILLDQNFTIRFASEPTRKFMAENGYPDIIGASAFDLFLSENQIKFKNKLIKTMMSGQKEKIKKVRLNGNFERPSTFKIKVTPTVFGDSPALILKIKDPS